jgi:hypothetical protein
MHSNSSQVSSYREWRIIPADQHPWIVGLVYSSSGIYLVFINNFVERSVVLSVHLLNRVFVIHIFVYGIMDE